MLRTRELPFDLKQPGILSGRGINRSVVRSALGINELWNCQNIEPTTEGLSNENIGVSKLNTSRLKTSPIQTMFIEGSNLYFVCDGDFCSMPLSGGAQSVESAGAFSTSGRPSWTKGIGASRAEKVYICDGVNQPKTWDGSSLTAISAFASDILTEIKTSNRPDKVTTYAERVVWGFPSTGVNKNYILASDLLNGDSYTSGAGADNAWFELVDAGNSYISAINSIQYSGSDEVNELLVAHKPEKSFVGRQDASPSTNRFGVFSNFARGIGCINQNSTVGFQNNIYALSKLGIGGVTNVADEVTSSVLQEGIRVNSLVQDSAINTGFENSFALHCPDRNLIWFFMPASSATTAVVGDITYPEAPCNLSICYKYALTTQTGQVTDFWYTREGAGWGWSCAVCDGKDVYLGSYFGDIYKVFDGNEYERNPSASATVQPIMSKIEYGDLDLGTGYHNYKALSDLSLYWFIMNGLTFDFSAIWDEFDTPKTTITKNLGSTSGAAVWDVALWDVAEWSESENISINITPPDGGRTVRFMITWNSIRDTLNNYGIYRGLSGIVSDGSRMLRFR